MAGLSKRGVDLRGASFIGTSSISPSSASVLLVADFGAAKCVLEVASMHVIPCLSQRTYSVVVGLNSAAFGSSCFVSPFGCGVADFAEEVRGVPLDADWPSIFGC